jgi:hypothetical protein
MGDTYKERYGISGPDVTHLIRRFYRYFLDSDWERADDFVKWCSENGWQKGLRLCRLDTSKPHGPDNSYFNNPEMTVKGKQADIRRRKEERKNLVSPFCEGCTEKCREGVGYERWQQYYVTNWNQNISIAKPVLKEDPGARRVFRYEHPDLVREGIVFEGSGSM